MPTLIQEAAAGVSFDGTTGLGLFSFETFDRLPFESRIILYRVFIDVLDDGGNPGVTGDVLVTLNQRPTVLAPPPRPSITLLSLPAADTGQLITVNGRSSWFACDRELPRDIGTLANWWVTVLVDGKAGLGWCGVDYGVQARPQSSPQDGASP